MAYSGDGGTRVGFGQLGSHGTRTLHTNKIITAGRRPQKAKPNKEAKPQPQPNPAHTVGKDGVLRDKNYRRVLEEHEPRRVHTTEAERRLGAAKAELFRAVVEKIGENDFYQFLKLSEPKRIIVYQQLNLNALYDSFKTAYIDLEREQEGTGT